MGVEHAGHVCQAVTAAYVSAIHRWQQPLVPHVFREGHIITLVKPYRGQIGPCRVNAADVNTIIMS